MNVYFGHPINTYGTDLEERLLIAIAVRFPGCPVCNPAGPKHQDGYAQYVAAGRRGMDYFFEEILPRCQAGVFLAFPDGKWGAGVYAEAAWLAERGHPIWQIDASGAIEPLDLATAEVLSVEETRARVRPR